MKNLIIINKPLSKIVSTVSISSAGPLHRHENLEKKLKLSNWNKFEEHAIVDEKQRLEGVEAIKIIREILFRDDDQLPKYLGISNLLDKKIHERLQNG